MRIITIFILLFVSTAIAGDSTMPPFHMTGDDVKFMLSDHTPVGFVNPVKEVLRVTSEGKIIILPEYTCEQALCLVIKRLKPKLKVECDE